MGCGTSFAKILLIIFNIVFWLSGAALLGVGIWLLVDPAILTNLELLSLISGSGNLLKFAAYVFIGVGAFVLVVGFFGCCGAIKENRCMLGVYIFFLVLIMGLEIAGGVLAIIYKDKIEETLEKELSEAFMSKYNKTSEEDLAFTEALNFVQAQLKCCGVKGPADYATLVPAVEFPIQCCHLKSESEDKDRKTLTVRDVGDLKGCRAAVPGTLYTDPPQCCVLKDSSAKNDIKTLTNADVKDYPQCKLDLGVALPVQTEYAYGQGCEAKFRDWVQMHAVILIGVGIGIACLELFGFIFAVCLCRSIQDDD